MTYTAIDCQSFAGGFALGVVKAGFELIGKREQPGGFGVPVMESNRHLLGDKWEVEACPAPNWTPLQANLVFGNPPCSRFSVMSSSAMKQTTKDSIDQCMFDLVDFASKCDPEIVIFESVQAAYTKGRDLMLELRRNLEEATGQTWNLHHVLHNVADLGGAQQRRRYFWVAARIPFGVDLPEGSTVTLRDRIGDLEDVEPDKDLGHVTWGTPRTIKLKNLVEAAEWNPGEASGTAFARRPDIIVDSQDRFETGFAARRLDYDKPSRVLVGDSLGKYMHPVKPRNITYREAARLMGFPDDWKVTEYQEKVKRGFWFGKGICVEAGQWIAKAAHDAISGNPQGFGGTRVGRDEYLIDAEVSNKQEEAMLF